GQKDRERDRGNDFPSVPLSVFLSLFSAGDLAHSDFAACVVALIARLGVTAAKDYAPVSLFSVVATETSTPAFLRVGVVFFDDGRRGRILIVAGVNRMTGRTINEFNVLGVREPGAVSAAHQLGGEGFGASGNHLCVADYATVFHARLVVEAPWRVALVTFRVRADRNGQRFLGRFMAE